MRSRRGRIGPCISEKNGRRPSIGTPLEETLPLLDGNWDVVFRVRAYVEQLQEMFFARKADLVADDHWRAMHWLVRSFFAPEIDRTIFESFIEMGWVTSGIRKVWARVRGQRYWKDPLGRLEAIQGRSLTSGDRVNSSDEPLSKLTNARFLFRRRRFCPATGSRGFAPALPRSVSHSGRRRWPTAHLLCRQFVRLDAESDPENRRPGTGRLGAARRGRTLRCRDALVFLPRDPARTGGAAGGRAA